MGPFSLRRCRRKEGSEASAGDDPPTLDDENRTDPDAPLPRPKRRRRRARADRGLPPDNVLAELDSPGEWYLDRKTALLYLWPPEPIENSRIVISILESPAVELKDTSYVVLRDLIVEDTGGTRHAGYYANAWPNYLRS